MLAHDYGVLCLIMPSQRSSLDLSRRAVRRAIRLIPRADFADVQFDRRDNDCAELKSITVVLSTPRSGSTMVCDMIRVAGGPVIHEYFQPHQYIQILAARWGCITRSRSLDTESYVRQLIAHRTSSEGELGVNLHGSHLDVFSLAEKAWPWHLPHRFIHLTRRDISGQAVSWSLARQSRAWSSDFEPGPRPRFDFESIYDKYLSIRSQNIAIERWLRERSASAETFAYEDVAEDPTQLLNFAVARPVRAPALGTRSRLATQRSALNAEWRSRFLEELETRQLDS